MTTSPPAIEWTGDGLRIVDQTRLPKRLCHVEIGDVDALVHAIASLAIRGAPALGVAGAFGVAIAMLQGRREGWGGDELDAAVARLRSARPTAVNLAAGVDRARSVMDGGVAAVLAEAEAVMREDTAANTAMARRGADWLLEEVPRRPLRVLTHCNTGTLVCCGPGTALGVVRELWSRGALEIVYVDETRPLLQGARLTAWELAIEGIPHLVQVDAAAASTITRGLVDVAVIGADRIAANGDTANKIGSLPVALACRAARIPFVVVAPSTTLDLSAGSGADIPIELRPEAEVLGWQGHAAAPSGSAGYNPAFDVTPGHLISAVITESAVFEVSAGQRPRRAGDDRPDPAPAAARRAARQG